jgi:hypothetical protein
VLYILLSVGCSVAIANLLMLFNRKGEVSIFPVFLGNYFLASVFSFAALPRGISGVTLFDVLFGIATGALFLGNFWVYQKSITVNGLSLSVGVMRIAMIVPVLIAVGFFAEKISLLNGVGIVLGLAAFSLKANPRELRNLLWIIGLFLVSGFTDASLKIYKELGSGSEQLFIWLIFSSAFFFTLFAILRGKIRFGVGSVLFGCLLGIPNRYSTVFFLKALDSVPASLAYPLTAVSIVLLSIASDLLFWKKRAGIRDGILWALLILSLLLLNLK